MITQLYLVSKVSLDGPHKPANVAHWRWGWEKGTELRGISNIYVQCITCSNNYIFKSRCFFFCQIRYTYFKTLSQWWLSEWHPACQFWIWGRSHGTWATNPCSYKACALWAHRPQLLKPTLTRAVVHKKATPVKARSQQLESDPCSLQPREKPVQPQRPNTMTAKIAEIIL